MMGDLLHPSNPVKLNLLGFALLLSMYSNATVWNSNGCRGINRNLVNMLVSSLCGRFSSRNTWPDTINYILACFTGVKVIWFPFHPSTYCKFYLCGGLWVFQVLHLKVNPSSKWAMSQCHFLIFYFLFNSGFNLIKESYEREREGVTWTIRLQGWRSKDLALMLGGHPLLWHPGDVKKKFPEPCTGLDLQEEIWHLIAALLSLIVLVVHWVQTDELSTA